MPLYLSVCIYQVADAVEDMGNMAGIKVMMNIDIQIKDHLRKKQEAHAIKHNSRKLDMRGVSAHLRKEE